MYISLYTKAKLDATSQRRVASLANYDFKISYRGGHLNSDADGLSRKPIVFNDRVNAICQSVMALVAYCQSVTMDVFPSSAEDEMNSYDTFVIKDWRQEQSQDKTIGRVIDIMRSGLRPGEKVSRRNPCICRSYLECTRSWN